MGREIKLGGGKMKHMLLYNRIRAILAKKRVFYVPDLNRICFAKDQLQCMSKYQKHDVVELRGFIKWSFILGLGKWRKSDKIGKFSKN